MFTAFQIQSYKKVKFVSSVKCVITGKKCSKNR